MAVALKAKLNYSYSNILRKRTLKGLRKRLQNTIKPTLYDLQNNDLKMKFYPQIKQLTANKNEFVIKNEKQKPLKVEIAEPLHFTFESTSTNYSIEV